MLGSTLFQWLRGGFTKIGYLKTTELPLSDADANAGTLKRGKLVAIKLNDETLMAFRTGGFCGILERNVDAFGTTGTTGRMRVYENTPDTPAKRGQAVSLRIPHPQSEAIFEGVGAAGYDTLVITATTTGFLTTGSAEDLELTCEKGGWRAAAIGEIVHALLKQANYSPAVPGNVRIRVRFTGPYKKTA